MSEKKEPIKVTFAAINDYVETHVISPRVAKVSGKDWLEWGERNIYPDYLHELYSECPTLRSIINGCVDYACGNGVTITGREEVNRKGMTAAELARCCFEDYAKYGGFCVEVIRDHNGQPAEVVWLDMRYIRTNEEADVFWYSEQWSNRYGRRDKDVLTFPKFVPDNTDVVESVLMVKASHSCAYPEPMYVASVKDAETERCISDYHLNSINNGFCGSFVVNFNNGVPEDPIKDEIERKMNEKFTGHQNAGRAVYSWNENKDCATTITPLEVQDFGEKYESLSKHCRQQLFTAFRAVPNLFGIATESNGFNAEEYESAFKLFNRTTIRPMQNAFVKAMNRIYGSETTTIEPFTLD